VLIDRKMRRRIAAVTGLTLASAPALALPARPALILPPALSEKAEIAGHRLGIRDYELAMLMMAKMMPGVGAQGTGGGASAAGVDIQLGTASDLDALSTTGWDLLIAKSRANATDWVWRDSARGMSKRLASNTQSAEASFSSYATHLSSGNAVLYRFKNLPGVLSVVSYTGTGSPLTVAHALASVPGMMIIRRSDGLADWLVYHRSLSAEGYLYLNTTAGYTAGPYSGYFNNTSPTSSVFSVGNDSYVNASGAAHIAYVFGHDTTSTGLIQCGTFTTNGSGVGTFATGWANGAQLALIHNVATSGPWELFDTARTPTFSGNDARVSMNSSAAEDSVARVSQSSGTLTFSGLNTSEQYIGAFIRAA
jgi:hypothetical protein